MAKKTLGIVLAFCMTLTALPLSGSRVEENVHALDSAACMFHSTFESGTEQWSARGSSSVTATQKKAFAGSQSLYVSGRESAWNGAGYTLSSTQFTAGQAYSFGVTVMQNSIASEDFKLSLQCEVDGEAQYLSVAQGSAQKGQWLMLANESFLIPQGAENLLLYVETLENLTSFYMDEAVGGSEGMAYAVQANPLLGDVNRDGGITVADVYAMSEVLSAQRQGGDLQTDDMDANGRIDAVDLTLLKRYVMNPPEVEEEPDLPERVEGTWYNTADISWIDPAKPMVALSFDDGPVGIAATDTSIRIQNAIADAGFHATFFYCVNLWGKVLNSTTEQEIIRAHELGFEVANHTYSHPDLSTLSAAEVQSEINDCARELTRLTGRTDFLIRPPYLAVNQTVQANAGAPLITCAVDSLDWNQATAQQMIDSLTQKMNDGSLDNAIVLMHETNASTAQAVEYLVPVLKANGWQVVTISEMFRANGKDMYDGQIYRSAN
ncbi:MAG: polysaccharide deacetylase family protein [Oscillospiraceae bacterium]|nr:polysaccharide deacetylase family protein [Oscillospiraceae bacterium]